MGQPWVIAFVLAACVVVVGTIVWRRINLSKRRQSQADAIASFASQLPSLEAEFLVAAGATGKPRGLRWTGCQLAGEPLFAVDRTTRELFALVGATVSFAAIEGGDMEDVEAVGNLRAATAVFVHRDGRWTTDGRAVFNLDPEGTLEHYRDTLESTTARLAR